ncbi:sugar/nucleoside kinase (ribokinase family) [Rhizobium sp. BK529]|uniref:PfkB family carbohydrate kinase n=1 Tax=unclassified Rhizobium TaxID=2613769 RepID=UPI0010453E4F|nr:MULTISPECIES: PfkB family carbohydrate kinase [unclassified Rhizobium]MBB3593597.1 sugar/nucleoside kinase (ribokinase family) [Rhizobium sp. BK529]TCS03385.1 sugar/nucleoside kinase (ribokinase family) [Rhizobium sp. BK418]
MARVMVVGNANVDRIWWLDRPLVPGGRLSCQSIEKRYGGGGFNTGLVLLDLGHEVVLVASLYDDDEGRAYLKNLGKRGFNTDFVDLVPGTTPSVEILVDINGERTIIAPAGRRRPGIEALPQVDASLVYLNARAMSATALRQLDDFDRVVSQYPLFAERRPANVLIASRSDMKGAAQAAWQTAAEIAEPRLETLVLTSGMQPIEIVTGQDQVIVDVPRAAPVRDTTGAGDYFAGGYIDAMIGGLDASSAALAGCKAAAARLAASEHAGP